jgi:hypothetical protein
MINPKKSTEIWESVEKYTDVMSDFIMVGNDFIDLTPSHRTYNYNLEDDYFSGTVIGMPPKGVRTDKEIEYFNACAVFAEVIIFVVPKTFRKISVQNRLSMEFVLEYEMELGHDAFIENGKPADKPYIVQVWCRGDRQAMHPVTGDFSFVKFSSLAIRRNGAKAGEIVRNLLKYSNSFYYIEPHIDNLSETLESIDWTVVSHNTIGVPSISKSEIIWLYNKGIAGELIWLEV